MSTLLQQAISALNLQPGQTYRTRVNGHEIEVRVVELDTQAESPKEPSQFADLPMVDLWLDVPASPAAKTITVQRGEPLLPSPLNLEESDLTPE